MPPRATREFDVLLFGATGFTGGLTAEYLARRSAERGAAERGPADRGPADRGPAERGPAGEPNAPFRWAIAGRNEEKLRGVLDRLAREAPDAPSSEITLPEIVVASVDDPASLRAMASRTRALASTVGPFAEYGEPVVAACVAERTHYCDITGEPGFVVDLLERWDGPARDAGVRLVTCCGFDSVPHDLGALLAVRALPAGEPLRVEGVVRASGTLSGGTWQSAVKGMGEARKSMGALRKGLDPASGREGPGRKVGSTRPKVRREKRLDAWVAPMPTIDPWIVMRSACALEEYGPDFRYGHYVWVKSLPRLVAGAAFVGGVSLLAQLPPTRKLLLAAKKSGEGPDAETRERSRFTVYMFGETVQGESESGATVRVEVSGGDPGYGETSKMLAESLLSLALDDLPERHGLLTPAAAMGDALLGRLRGAGMRFERVG